MNDKRLGEIEARLNRATPGPWIYRWAYDILDNFGNLLMLGDYVYTQQTMEPYLGLSEERQQIIRDYEAGRLIAKIETVADDGEADGEFVAHAWQDIKDLLLEIRRLKKQMDSKENVLVEPQEGDSTDEST